MAPAPVTVPDSDTGRLEAFSDGVFAIAITLLVLDLKPASDPAHPDLASALAVQWPTYVSFLASFAVIGIMWLNHHYMFRLIRRSSHGVLLLNTLLLLMITVVPFPTAIVSEHIGTDGARLAAAMYTGWFVLTSLAWNALWRFAASAKRSPPVLAIPADSPRVLLLSRSYLMGPVIYGTAFLVSLWVPVAGVALCGLVAIFFALRPPE
jgi:uncharacterized membrane protein